MLYLAIKLVDAPSAFISKSVGDVFLSQIARTKESQLAKACFKNMKVLCILSTLILIPYVLTLWLFGEKIFGVIWDPRIRIYLTCLVPSAILQISLGSTGLAFVTSNRNLNGLIAQIGMLICRLAPISVFIMYGGPDYLLPHLVALGLFVGYSFYGYVLIKSLKRPEVRL